MKRINYNKLWENDIPEWNKEELWSIIEKSLNSNKDRSKPVYILLFACSLVLGFGVLWNHFGKINNMKPEISKSIEKKRTKMDFGDEFYPEIKNDSVSLSKQSTEFFFKTNEKLEQVQSTEIDQYPGELKVPGSEVTYGTYSLGSHAGDLADVRKDENIQKLPGFLVKLFRIQDVNLVDFNSNQSIPPEKSVLNHPFNWISANTALGFGLTITDHDKNSFWQSRKLRNEKIIVNYSASLLFGKSVFRNFTISTGMDYQNQMINFVDRDSIMNINSFQSDSAFFVNSSEPIYFSGERTITNIKYRNLDVLNEISHISIPLFFNYHYTATKFGYSFGAGVLFRVHSIFKGYTVNHENNIVPYNNYLQYIKKYKGITDLKLTGHYRVSLIENVNLNLGIEVGFPLKPSYTLDTDGVNPFRDKSISFNSQFGLSYLFR